MESFDIVVIGAGPGGYPAAIRAAQLGAKVAVIEKEQLGGTCLNWGCIPTKAMIAASDLFAKIRHAEAFGITVKGAALDYRALAGHKNRVVEQLRGKIKQLLTANGVEQIAGMASFVDHNTIEAAGSRIGAKRTLIATGLTSTMPAFLPKHPRVVESRGFLELDKLPESLIVMGGGYIGCELASMAAQLDVKVTIVELLEDILLALDGDVRRQVRTHMEKSLGIRILTGKALEKVTASDKLVSGNVGDETIEAGLLLVSVGRKPVTDGLKLENAGVKANEMGFIPVDDFGRTNATTIYAIGDVNGRTQLAHNATSQGIIAAENAVGKKPHRYESLVPNVIFTVPEVGTVGLSEDDAKRQGRAVVTGKFQFAGLGRALAVNEAYGFVKWIADTGTDQLLGAAAIGPHATELIAEASLAIRSELTVAELGRTIHAHPTFSESWMEAAHAVHSKCVHAPPRKHR